MLYAIVGCRLTGDLLLSTYCFVKQSLNDCSLSSISSDANDWHALTPNHFLLGNDSTCLPSLSAIDYLNHRKRYARAQAYANAFWKRLSKEYLPRLNFCCKWKTPSDEAMKTGYLVSMMVSGSPRGFYPLARFLSLLMVSTELDGPLKSMQHPAHRLLLLLIWYWFSNHQYRGLRMLLTQLRKSVNEKRLLLVRSNRLFQLGCRLMARA